MLADAPDTATTGESTDQKGAQAPGDVREPEQPSTSEETNQNTDGTKTKDDVTNSPDENHDPGEL